MPAKVHGSGGAIVDAPPDLFSAASSYLTDAIQRTGIFLDVMRRRGNQFTAYTEGRAEPVLSYEYDVVARGTELPRPINYHLVRIKPPTTMSVDPAKRPFVVIDPRAGHGPGIGGFKADSEIGMALQAGHPCYFIGFTPEPVPGQTIEDIAHGEAAFLERVIALHPDADGKPAVIGNCQAGWAVMIVAALRPELFGPIIVAGAPLSYWAGVRGSHPMRYSGGLLGGSWLTAMIGDLGAGRFDGAWLVSNFEGMNPANTYWTKQYNVWNRVDTEAERYLGFERWWGGHVFLNAGEMQWIVDNLFVGNKLATADIVTGDGVRIDLRNIRSPIVCFCSRGDDITPPQQALDWVLDLYASDEDIRAHGQTIVFCVHPTVGHLGIFVSGAVARKEHDEFASNIDFIDVLPPGLYEAVITDREPGDAGDPMITGNYVLRFEQRTLADIRQLGGNDEADERRFAAMARVSDINLGLYRTFMQPFVRALVSPELSRPMAKLHPTRLSFELFADSNPMMAGVARWAEHARATRQPATRDNPFLAMQEQVSRWTVDSLERYGRARDSVMEASFLAFYGSPLLQAMLGMRASDGPARQHPGTGPEHRVFIADQLERLRARIDVGGVREAAVRAMLYIMAPQQASDERNFNVIRQLREEYGGRTSLAEFKEIIREQVQMLRLDTAAAVAALPRMLASEPGQEEVALAAVRRVVLASGELSEVAATRLDEIGVMFGAADEIEPPPPAKPVPGAEVSAKPSRAPVKRRPRAIRPRSSAG